MKGLFVGSKLFGYRCLQVLLRIIPGTICAVITLDDKMDTRSAYENFKNITTCPIFILKNIDDLTYIYNKYLPDFVFVSGWYRIIPLPLLRRPRLGFFAFHFSMLPCYRGGAPVVWAIINGEKKTGYSLFSMNEKMDEGPLYIQESIDIGDNDTIADVQKNIEIKALTALENNFADILCRKIAPYPQPNIPASYGAQRIPDDALIDWKRPQKAIYNWIRAQSFPYPGAFTFINGKKLHIWNASPILQYPYYATPGQVICFNNENALVACGDNKLLQINKVSLEGDVCSPKEALKTIGARLKNF